MPDSTTQEVDNTRYTAALNRAIRRLLTDRGVTGKYADQAMTDAVHEIVALDKIDTRSDEYTIRMDDAMVWIGSIFPTEPE